MGRSARGEFPERGQEACCRAWIVEGIQGDGRGKLWRLGAKADLEHILLTDRHERVELRSRIVFPMGAGGQNDRARLVNVPLALIAFPGDNAAAVGAPAMAYHIEAEAWGTTKIGFEGKGLFLAVNAAQDPLDRQGPWPESQNYARVVKAAGRELKSRIEAGTIEPAEINDAAFACTRCLDPAQRFGPAAAVVGGEQDVPAPKSDNRTDNVDDKKASHNVFTHPYDDDGTSEVATRARGQWSSRREFFEDGPAWLWKSRFQGPDWALSGDRLGQSGIPNTIAAVAAIIRQFRREDFDSLWRMDQECFAQGIAYSKQELRSFIGHRGAFTLVASEDGTPQGFIVALNGAIGHVITIDVSPKARRSGVGSLLLGAAEQQLAANGSRAVGLETAVDNLAALSFYKRHGYSVVRTWPRYYSNGVDALVLRKSLPEKS